MPEFVPCSVNVTGMLPGDTEPPSVPISVINAYGSSVGSL